MANSTSARSKKVSRRATQGAHGDSRSPSKVIRFSAILHRPAATSKTSSGDGGWTFLILPREASAKLPSRSMVSVEGAINGLCFQATLEPDGQGGHWLKVDQKLRKAAGADVGDVVSMEITPLTPDQEPEPKVPADLRKALEAAPTKAREVWAEITPIARRDWIHWMVSAKQAATRARRVTTACDMLAKGKRRPCCFDRSGMYDKSLSCPVADE
jgi:hypothetical protein